MSSVDQINVTENVSTPQRLDEILVSLVEPDRATSVVDIFLSIIKSFEALNIHVDDPVFSTNESNSWLEWKLCDKDDDFNWVGTMVFGGKLPCKFWIRLNKCLSSGSVGTEFFLINGFQQPRFFYTLHEAHLLNRHFKEVILGD